MDFRPDSRQQIIENALTTLFSMDDLGAIIHQACEHDRGAGNQDTIDHDARETIWKELVALGVLIFTLPEEVGGMSLGQATALTVAEQMGRALYQSPYFDTLFAAEILQVTGDRSDVLEQIAHDGCTIAVAARSHGADSLGTLPPITLRLHQGKALTVDASRRFVPFVPDVNYLLVLGQSSQEPVALLFPVDDHGVAFRRHDDIGRSDLYAVDVSQGKVTAGARLLTGNEFMGQYAQVLARTRTRHAAYLVGLSRGAFDDALAYAKEREQFGRPIARFQSVAFRLAALAVRIDAARLLAYESATMADQGQDLRMISAEVLAMAADLARAVTADALHFHGATGMREEARAQRYYRRAALDATWLGTPTQLREEAMELFAVRHSSHTTID
jgi:alkylation response protein AidB-like acyl-CoA dehydrogenase